jgi:hypothetical protein
MMVNSFADPISKKEDKYFVLLLQFGLPLILELLSTNTKVL